MKKMTKKDANEIYRIAKASLDNVAQIEYKVGDISTTVDVYTRLALADIKTVMTEVVVASFAGGEYNEIFKDAQFSKCVIEYMTNLPLPTFKNEKNETSIDLNLCHEIVFGKNGLANSCPDLKETLDEMNHYILTQIIDIRKSSSPSEQVFQKLLDLYIAFKSEIEDVKNNPTRVFSLIENLPIEQFGDMLTDYMDKN